VCNPRFDVPGRPRGAGGACGGAVDELSNPTLSEGETYEKLLADRTAFEDYSLDTRVPRATASPVSNGLPCNISSAPAESKGPHAAARTNR
jgi:hypothetical protein